ncbi:depolymerase [Xenophilus sp. AP218F]|nr:PHB depolymerase family esterase [Chromobacterium sp. ASV5]OWY41080.1 depolymerase [Xenophilus sp. AP218F]
MGVKQIAAALCLAVAPLTSATAAPALPAFHGDPAQSSVSGLSSGAFMALQYQVAYSASVVGVGVVAGGPYYCAQGRLLGTLACMTGTPPATADLLAAARGFAARGEIDPLANLAKRRAYLFSGSQDHTVLPGIVNAAYDFLRGAGMPAAGIRLRQDIPAGHGQITPAYGNTCGITKPPFLNHCQADGKGYDQAGAILGQIYPGLLPPAATLSGRVVAFDQRPFGGKGDSLAEEGYVYVPRACQAGEPCRVHIALHGCQQSAGKVGDAYYAHAGYNAWADANRILVLYPQVNPSLANPQGCWDWFGFSGDDYAWKRGAQMRAIKAMADRLVSGG